MAAGFIALGTLAEKLGFDDEAAPPWLMVPVGGTRRVTLTNGAGLTLSPANPADSQHVSVSEVSPRPEGRQFDITGKTPRTLSLQAKDHKGTVQASLDVTIKAKVTLKTFIGFIFDKAGRTTVRGLADALQLVEVANKITLPQTNVEMVRQDSGGIRLPFELPQGMPADLSGFSAPKSWERPGPGLLPCISSRLPGPEGCMPETSPGPLKPNDFKALVEYQILTNIVNRVNPVFDYNILFVRFFAQGTGIAAATGAFTPVSTNGVEVNLCFMPDAARGQSLAHELCHYLLRLNPPHTRPGHHSAGRFDLMVESPGPENIKITKSQANTINPSGWP